MPPSSRPTVKFITKIKAAIKRKLWKAFMLVFLLGPCWDLWGRPSARLPRCSLRSFSHLRHKNEEKLSPVWEVTLRCHVLTYCVSSPWCPAGAGDRRQLLLKTLLRKKTKKRRRNRTNQRRRYRKCLICLFTQCAPFLSRVFTSPFLFPCRVARRQPGEEDELSKRWRTNEDSSLKSRRNDVGRKTWTLNFLTFS